MDFHFTQKRLANCWYYVFVGVVVITTGFIWNWEKSSVDVPLPPAVKTNEPRVPDYTLKKFVTARMDEQGIIKTQLQAEEMAHYLNISTELKTPQMMFFQQENPTWIVHAEQGKLSGDNNELWLLGRSSLQYQNKTRPVEIQSQDIYVRVDRKTAETKAPATIIMGTGQVQTMGMQAFLNTQQVILGSQVRGNYVPIPR